MRTIKFRGKDIETGEWVYVDLLNKESVTNAFIAIIHRCNVKINPDTVGQFTGLTDKNGKEIYEGDIMRIPETETNIEIIGVVEFNRGSYVVRSFLSGTCSSLAWAVRERQSGERRGVVIGNIHDNPELLNN